MGLSEVDDWGWVNRIGSKVAALPDTQDIAVHVAAKGTICDRAAGQEPIGRPLRRRWHLKPIYPGRPRQEIVSRVSRVRNRRGRAKKN